MEANQFVVGKWYRNKENGQYARFTKISGTNNEPDRYFHWSERLDNTLNHEYYNGSWYRTSMEEANMSVIACGLSNLLIQHQTDCPL